MKRPVGVVVSAVLLILGSLFLALMALLMAFSGFFIQNQMRSGQLPRSSAAPMPGWMPAFIFAFCIILAALAAWGIVTAVGVLRLRRWARYSILVIGGLVAFFSFIALLFTLLMMVLPLPTPPTADPSQAASARVMVKIVFGVFGLFYALACAVGVSWLIYFTRKSVCEAFAGAAGEPAESRRPLPISVLAALNLLGALSCLFCILVPLPAMFLGLSIGGLGKVALYLGFAALAASAGVGLWRLKEWGRLLALGMQAIGLVNAAIYLVHPALMVRYSAEFQQKLNPMQPRMPEAFQSMLYRCSFGLTFVLILAVVGVLVYYREAFQNTDEPTVDQAAPPE